MKRCDVVARWGVVVVGWAADDVGCCCCCGARIVKPVESWLPAMALSLSLGCIDATDRCSFVFVPYAVRLMSQLRKTGQFGAWSAVCPYRQMLQLGTTILKQSATCDNNRNLLPSPPFTIGTYSRALGCLRCVVPAGSLFPGLDGSLARSLNRGGCGFRMRSRHSRERPKEMQV